MKNSNVYLGKMFHALGCKIFLYEHVVGAMSLRAKRPFRSDDGSVPAKRRKVSSDMLKLCNFGCAFRLFLLFIILMSSGVQFFLDQFSSIFDFYVLNRGRRRKKRKRRGNLDLLMISKVYITERRAKHLPNCLEKT